MHNALKPFYFIEKIDAQEGVFFLIYQFVMEMLFYEKC